MKIQEAIRTLDEVIPSPDNKMVDGEHLEIAIAWKTIRNTLLLKQRETTGWIPVEERLPDIYETVLVSVLSANGYGEPATYETLGWYNKEWELYTPLHKGERVIYWMQMPEPPTEY